MPSQHDVTTVTSCWLGGVREIEVRNSAGLSWSGPLLGSGMSSIRRGVGSCSMLLAVATGLRANEPGLICTVFDNPALA